MRDERTYLWDMLQSAELVRGYVAGMTRDVFENDGRTQDAVVRRLAIFGEAAKKVTQPTRDAMPGVPFDDAARMSDIMTHVYRGVSPDTVWDTATRDGPALTDALQGFLPPETPPAPGGTPNP